MQSPNSQTFSIVVPLFNEEDNIYPLVRTIIEAVAANPGFLEIILVDDGSRDKTAVLALKLAEEDKRIRLVRHKRNLGLGAAIRTGLGAARGNFVLYTDADLPFDFKLIPQLLSMASENCVVSGYRLNRGEGGRRWILTTVYNFLIWLFFGLSMRDVNFACKIFPRAFLQKGDFTSVGSFIDVELLLEARRLGLRIIEHPLVYYPRTRGLSTLSRPQVILFILREMFAYTSGLFLNANTFVGFIKTSPLTKLAVCLMTILTSTMFFLEKVGIHKVGFGLFLTFGAAIASLLLSIVYSQLVYRSWKLARQSHELKTSE